MDGTHPGTRAWRASAENLRAPRSLSDGRGHGHDIGPPRRAVPVITGDQDQPARPALGEDLVSIASDFVLRQHATGLHAVGQRGARSFDLNGIAAAQISDVVKDPSVSVAYGVSDDYRRSSGCARNSAVTPPSGDTRVSWRLEYPLIVALDSNDSGIYTDSGNAQRVRALDATSLNRCCLGLNRCRLGVHGHVRRRRQDWRRRWGDIVAARAAGSCDQYEGQPGNEPGRPSGCPASRAERRIRSHAGSGGAGLPRSRPQPQW